MKKSMKAKKVVSKKPEVLPDYPESFFTYIADYIADSRNKGPVNFLIMAVIPVVYFVGSILFLVMHVLSGDIDEVFADTMIKTAVYIGVGIGDIYLSVMLYKYITDMVTYIRAAGKGKFNGKTVISNIIFGIVVIMVIVVLS